MRCLTWLLVLALILSVLAELVRAQDDEDDSVETDASEEEEAAKPSGPVFSCFFPAYDKNVFPASKTIEAVVGLKNQGTGAYNVEFMRGSVIHGMDSTRYLQNFTGGLYNSSVAPGDEVTLVYRFSVSEMLEPMDYGLIVEVFFSNDDNETFLHSVFNSSVTITDPETGFDVVGALANLSLIGIFGFVGFVVFKVMGKKGGKRKPAGSLKTYTPAPAVVADGEAPVAANKGGIDWDYITEEEKNKFLGRSNSESPPRKTSPTRGRKRSK